MRRFGLIGYPLGHSFSQKFFTEKFEQEGLTDCQYELFAIDRIARLPELLVQHPDLAGLNVTIPYKEQVLPYLYQLHMPAELPACNCIRMHQGKLHGFNTDAIGFEQTLKPLLQPHHQQALVLGNGGAAMAVKYVLHKLAIPFQVVGRSFKPGIDMLFSDLTASTLRTHTLVINTTPLGTYPKVEECPPLPYEGLSPQHLLYDLVYNPPVTAFLKKGLQAGATTKNGYDMLVAQALESWRIWNSPLP